MHGCQFVVCRVLQLLRVSGDCVSFVLKARASAHLTFSGLRLVILGGIAVCIDCTLVIMVIWQDVKFVLLACVFFSDYT